MDYIGREVIADNKSFVFLAFDGNDFYFLLKRGLNFA